MRKLRTAVIGIGVMGSFYARILKQSQAAELVAICGRSEERVHEASEELGVPGYSNSAYDALFRDQGDLDAVVIATPETEHLAPVQASLEAGANLLVEKPLGRDANEAKRIVELARTHDKLLMVCHHLRFDPRYYNLASAVREGRLGQIINVYARRNPASSSAGRIDGRVPAPYWVGVHDIDLVHWITGKRSAKVFAKASGSSLEGLGVDDCIVSTITLEDGSLFLLENSWATAPTGGNPRSFLMSIRGSEGVGEVEAYQHGFAVYGSNGEVISKSGEIQFFPDLFGRATGIYRDMIDHFLHCLRSGDEPPVSGSDGLAAVRVADAIMHSLERGEEVDVSWD